MIVERKIRAIVCDGCDYDVVPERHVVLTLPYRLSDTDRGSLTFHFHEVGKEHDCLRYWIMNKHTMENSLKAREAITPRIRELILKTVGGFKHE
jgi:hypothetical protein